MKLSAGPPALCVSQLSYLSAARTETRQAFIFILVLFLSKTFYIKAAFRYVNRSQKYSYWQQYDEAHLGNNLGLWIMAELPCLWFDCKWGTSQRTIRLKQKAVLFKASGGVIIRPTVFLSTYSLPAGFLRVRTESSAVRAQLDCETGSLWQRVVFKGDCMY